MKKLFSSLVLKNITMLCMFVAILSYAQTTETAVEHTETVISFLTSLVVPGIVASLAVLVADASKWINSGQWSLSMFIQTKLKTFLFVNLCAVILALVIFYVPQAKNLIASVTGTDLTMLTTATIYATVTALIDGFSKKV